MHIAKWLKANDVEENNNCQKNDETECHNRKTKINNNHDDWLWAFERCDLFDSNLRRGDCARYRF